MQLKYSQGEVLQCRKRGGRGVQVQATWQTMGPGEQVVAAAEGAEAAMAEGVAVRSDSDSEQWQRRRQQRAVVAGGVRTLTPTPTRRDPETSATT